MSELGSLDNQSYWCYLSLASEAIPSSRFALLADRFMDGTYAGRSCDQRAVLRLTPFGVDVGRALRTIDATR